MSKMSKGYKKHSSDIIVMLETKDTLDMANMDGLVHCLRQRSCTLASIRAVIEDGEPVLIIRGAIDKELRKENEEKKKIRKEEWDDRRRARGSQPINC